MKMSLSSRNHTNFVSTGPLDNSNHTLPIMVTSWLSHYLKAFLQDSFVKKWLMTPVVYYFIILFIMPLLLCILLWSTSLILYIHRVHKRRLMRRLTEAFDERDILKAGRNIVAAIWDAQGWFWHGYEVIGLEKIPETGPALIVYYHGALPLDYYYLVAKMVLLKHRVIHSVVDRILFRIPGLTPILNTFCCTPGTKESCAKDLSEGNLLGISPGGIYEASFSDHKRYKVEWKSRVGFAKIALEAKVPIIPVFTKNIRESVRTISCGRPLMKWFYDKTRLPCAPIYGGFPVKMTTFIGEPIPYNSTDTPEELRDKCKKALEDLIEKHQRIPGSICLALFERFHKRHTS